MAGAGTGKTHLLAARLADLIGRQDVGPGDVLAPVSFSRAAVSEIRKRVALGGVTRGVASATFDSFATNLLESFEPAGDWRSENYERRIGKAQRDFSKQMTKRARWCRDFDICFIDEVQDLVGVRARLVMRLLATAQGGVTLFGDPAQSIYGFSEAGEKRDRDRAQIFEWVRQRPSDRFVERCLTRNFRATCKVTKSVLPFGERLQVWEPNHTAIRRDHESFVLQLPIIPELAHAVPMLLRRDSRSTAILCRTNGQVLATSGLCIKLSLEHHVQRRAARSGGPVLDCRSPCGCRVTAGGPASAYGASRVPYRPIWSERRGNVAPIQASRSKSCRQCGPSDGCLEDPRRRNPARS